MISVSRRFPILGFWRMSTVANAQAGPVEQTMHKKLTSCFEPVHLELHNESYMHNVPKGSETHFKVVVVSSQFEGKPLIQRHRAVNDALSEELKSGVHALSIIAKTPEQWEISTKEVEPSPKCRGGFGK
ncbi:putative bolA-like protein K11H12.1 [Thrips palmi]|uniref:BolA-like protein K11H12.1 n=1 Tax=Thrips palmi TaxID=161013 RepID=A0A6P8Z4B4_THRPL|nr:putative bolA-like protein K11H12.1 [Thrips palmi]